MQLSIKKRGGLAKKASFSMANLAKQADEQQRVNYFNQLQQAFLMAGPVPPKHAYVQQRLTNVAAENVLSRINMRWHDNKLWVPIARPGGQMVGLQSINPALKKDNKRSYVAFLGAMKGSFVRVAPVGGLTFYPILLCEGVFTALSLALVWPGEIRAVLSCYNFAACRKHLNESVYFAHDMDVYKPLVGNVGLNSAVSAAQAGDYFMTPQFLPVHQQYQPTDFNDLLCL